VIHGFAQDMLRTSDGELLTFDRMDAPTRDALLGNITDAYLQVELQTLAHEVVVADGHLAAGEAALVDTLWSRWHSRHINISTGDGIV
jgi:predicted carbohydrate-binding protein with CBM5 and CBM33 domain